MALPFKLVYSPNYDLNLGRHVFPAVKYKLIYERLLHDGIADAADFIAPDPASDDDMLRVHTRHWVTALRQGTLSYKEIIEAMASKKLWTLSGGKTPDATARRADGVVKPRR